MKTLTFDKKKLEKRLFNRDIRDVAVSLNTALSYGKVGGALVHRVPSLRSFFVFGY